MTDDHSRIPEFYRLSVEERVRVVHERGLLTGSDFRALATGKHTLDLESLPTFPAQPSVGLVVADKRLPPRIPL